MHQKKREQTGSLTAHDQQRTYLRKKGMKDPDPRNQILKDLTKLIEEYIPQGYHPMVIGDFNDDIDSTEMEKFMEDNLLIDIIADMHEEQPPRTYIHGSRRLDYILGDQHI